MPPGTGDVALSLSQTVPVAGAVVVTTPQQVSLADSRRAVRMYQKLNIPTLGVIENMSHFICPNCEHEADIFGRGGGERMAHDLGVPFIGSMPIYQPIREGGDTGRAADGQRASSPAARAFMAAAERIAAEISIASYKRSPIPLTPIHLNLPFTQTTLGNGLRVILHEDHRLPMAAVNIWYHVGSKNEQPGRTGFAHLFEHLMFEGSQHYDRGYFHPLQEAGASLNGSTNADRTNYWEVVPTTALELALWMESDRMGYLLPALTERKFENQREVVLNERRQNYENRPYGLAGMALAAALFPPAHPYHWLTIGERADLKAATFDEVRAFFQTYYHPSNASLVVAGDIEPAAALERVNAHFGDIPPGPGLRPWRRPPRSTRRCVWSSRIVSSSRGCTWPGIRLPCSRRATPRWISSPICSPTERCRGSTGRSCTRSASPPKSWPRRARREMASFWQLVATAAPGHALAELEREIDAALSGLLDEGPDRRRARTRPGAGRSAVHRPPPDPRRLWRQVRSAECLCRVSRRSWILRARSRPVRACERARPAGGRPAAPPPRSARRAERRAGGPAVARARGLGAGGRVMTAVDRTRLPSIGPTPPVRFPSIEKSRLQNGLSVWATEHRGLPLVTFALLLPAGSAADFEGYEGLAAITADMLDEGTGDRSAIDVNGAFAALGAHLDTEVWPDATLLTVTALSRFASPVLHLLAECVTAPRLTEADFARVRQLRLNRLVQVRDMPSAIADRAIMQVLYGGHPYAHAALGTEEALRQMRVENVRAFHAHAFSSSSATLMAAGDISTLQARQLADDAFGGWRTAGAPAGADPALAPPPAEPAHRLAVVDKTGAPQSEIRIGQVGLTRSTPDYFRLIVLNMVLGGQFVSRINMKLRQEKGLTYGARTSFDFRRGRGPFLLQTSVQSDGTGQAVEAALAELDDIRTGRPPTAEEIELAKAALTRGYARNFETVEQVARAMSQLALYGLPDDYFDTFVAKVGEVDTDQTARAATAHLDPARFATTIVGDAAAVGQQLTAAGLGEPEPLLPRL